MSKAKLGGFTLHVASYNTCLSVLRHRTFRSADAISVRGGAAKTRGEATGRRRLAVRRRSSATAANKETV